MINHEQDHHFHYTVINRSKNLAKSLIVALSFFCFNAETNAQITFIPSYCELTSDQLLRVFSKRLWINIEDITDDLNKKWVFVLPPWILTKYSGLKIERINHSFESIMTNEENGCFFNVEYTLDFDYGKYLFDDSHINSQITVKEIYDSKWLHIWNLIKIWSKGVTSVFVEVRSNETNWNINILHYFSQLLYSVEHSNIRMLKQDKINHIWWKLFGG